MMSRIPSGIDSHSSDGALGDPIQHSGNRQSGAPGTSMREPLAVLGMSVTVCVAEPRAVMSCCVADASTPSATADERLASCVTTVAGGTAICASSRAASPPPPPPPRAHSATYFSSAWTASRSSNTTRTKRTSEMTREAIAASFCQTDIAIGTSSS